MITTIQDMNTKNPDWRRRTSRYILLSCSKKWLMEAFDHDLPEPTAMTLATANSTGRISSRIILLKGFDTGGFQFYTNYKSQKGRDLEENSHAAISFFWPELERQVQIEGTVQKISERDSDLYHAARPRNNQLGAWASEQSAPIKDRQTLEGQYEAIKRGLQGPRPDTPSGTLGWLPTHA